LAFGASFRPAHRWFAADQDSLLLGFQADEGCRRPKLRSARDGQCCGAGGGDIQVPLTQNVERLLPRNPSTVIVLVLRSEPIFASAETDTKPAYEC
jgi:hypothetical protein